MKEERMNFKRIGIAGSGLMGTSIAQMTALHGYKTIVMKVTDGELDAVKTKIGKNIDKEIGKGNISKSI